VHSIGGGGMTLAGQNWLKTAAAIFGPNNMPRLRPVQSEKNDQKTAVRWQGE